MGKGADGEAQIQGPSSGVLLRQLAGVWESPQTLCRGAGALDLVVVLLVVFVIITVF